MLRRLLYSMALLSALAGCGEPDKTQSPKPAPPAALQGKFEAMSTTAMSITGDLDLTATKLSFSMDQSYQTRPLEVVKADAPYAHSGNWQSLLGIAAADSVEIRTVSEQSIGPKAAPNGGLCSYEDSAHKAPRKVTFIALARTKDTLRLAAFAGPSQPGKDASGEAGLCGTYNYAAK